jgi:hypothetical protein
MPLFHTGFREVRILADTGIVTWVIQKLLTKRIISLSGNGKREI